MLPAKEEERALSADVNQRAWHILSVKRTPQRVKRLREPGRTGPEL
jgi:hypothetical protein